MWTPSIFIGVCIGVMQTQEFNFNDDVLKSLTEQNPGQTMKNISNLARFMDSVDYQRVSECISSCMNTRKAQKKELCKDGNSACNSYKMQIDKNITRTNDSHVDSISLLQSNHRRAYVSSLSNNNWNNPKYNLKNRGPYRHSQGNENPEWYPSANTGKYADVEYQNNNLNEYLHEKTGPMENYVQNILGIREKPRDESPQVFRWRMKHNLNNLDKFELGKLCSPTTYPLVIILFSGGQMNFNQIYGNPCPLTQQSFNVGRKYKYKPRHFSNANDNFEEQMIRNNKYGFDKSNEYYDEIINRDKFNDNIYEDKKFGDDGYNFRSNRMKHVRKPSSSYLPFLKPEEDDFQKEQKMHSTDMEYDGSMDFMNDNVELENPPRIKNTKDTESYDDVIRRANYGPEDDLHGILIKDPIRLYENIQI